MDFILSIKSAKNIISGNFSVESEFIAGSGIGNLGKGVTKAEQGVWDMSVGGGNINGRRYSQHAKTPEVRTELYGRATQKAKELGYTPGTQKYSEFVNKYVDPRNIPSSVIEDAINNTKAVAGNKADTFVHETDSVKVIVNGNGDVITLIPK